MKLDVAAFLMAYVAKGWVGEVVRRLKSNQYTINLYFIFVY